MNENHAVNVEFLNGSVFKEMVEKSNFSVTINLTEVVLTGNIIVEDPLTNKTKDVELAVTSIPVDNFIVSGKANINTFLELVAQNILDDYMVKLLNFEVVSAKVNVSLNYRIVAEELGLDSTISSDDVSTINFKFKEEE